MQPGPLFVEDRQERGCVVATVGAVVLVVLFVVCLVLLLAAGRELLHP